MRFCRKTAIKQAQNMSPAHAEPMVLGQPVIRGGWVGNGDR